MYFVTDTIRVLELEERKNQMAQVKCSLINGSEITIVEYFGTG